MIMDHVDEAELVAEKIANQEATLMAIQAGTLHALLAIRDELSGICSEIKALTSEQEVGLGWGPG
jgi:hypothetical protein